jgi:hypothetical protein
MGELRASIEVVEGEIDAFYTEIKAEVKAVIAELMTVDEAALVELAPLRPKLEEVQEELLGKVVDIEGDLDGLV